MQLRELLENPDLYLLAFQENDALFASMDREAYRRSIFLDPPRISARSPEFTLFPYAPLAQELAAVGGNQSPVSYIFHVAHCGSTLLARALDVTNETLVLREPRTLRQLGVDAGRNFFGGQPTAEWQARFALTTALSSRRYRADAPVVVKANVPVNFMIPKLAATQLGPSIVLYYSLENYLTAILRTPNHRNWAESVTSEVPKAIMALTGRTGNDPVECAALLWLAQIKLYHQLTQRHANVASLDAEDFFNRSADVVRAAFVHIGKPQSDATIAEIVASDLFSRYSKNPQFAFTNEARLERAAQTRAELAPHLTSARRYIEGLPAARDLPTHLANDLLGGAVPLLAAS